MEPIPFILPSSPTQKVIIAGHLTVAAASLMANVSSSEDAIRLAIDIYKKTCRELKITVTADDEID